MLGNDITSLFWGVVAYTAVVSVLHLQQVYLRCPSGLRSRSEQCLSSPRLAVLQGAFLACAQAAHLVLLHSLRNRRESHRIHPEIHAAIRHADTALLMHPEQRDERNRVTIPAFKTVKAIVRYHRLRRSPPPRPPPSAESFRMG